MDSNRYITHICYDVGFKQCRNSIEPSFRWK